MKGYAIKSFCYYKFLFCLTWHVVDIYIIVNFYSFMLSHILVDNLKWSDLYNDKEALSSTHPETNMGGDLKNI